MDASEPTAAAVCAPFIHYDVTQWPLVRAVVQPGVTPSDDMFNAHLACFQELLERNKPFYIEFDARQAEGASFDQLRRQAAQMKELKPLIARNLVCSTVVVESAALKMLLDFLLSIVIIQNGYSWIDKKSSQNSLNSHRI